MFKHRITTHSKSDYLHCLRTIQGATDLKVDKATGDDWKCNFEIIFSGDNNCAGLFDNIHNISPEQI